MFCTVGQEVGPPRRYDYFCADDGRHLYLAPRDPRSPVGATPCTWDTDRMYADPLRLLRALTLSATCVAT